MLTYVAFGLGLWIGEILNNKEIHDENSWKIIIFDAIIVTTCWPLYIILYIENKKYNK